MRKSLLAILLLIALCGLCVTGIANATKAGFTQTDGTGSLVTVDGVIGPGEWEDSWKGNLYNGSTMTNSY